MSQQQELKLSIYEKLISSDFHFIALYFFVVGVSYLWGYWSCFGVNILEYVSFSDVIKCTAYPIVTAFLFNGLGLLVPELMGIQEKFPRGTGRETEIGKYINLDWAPVLVKKAIKFLFVIWCFIKALEIATSDGQNKWFLLPLMISFLLASMAENHGFFVSRIKNEYRRYIVLVILFALPMWLYGQGHKEANHILDSSEYNYLALSIDGIIDVGDSKNPDGQIKYLGHTGDYTFFLRAKDVLIMIKSDQIRILELKHVKNS